MRRKIALDGMVCELIISYKDLCKSFYFNGILYLNSEVHSKTTNLSSFLLFDIHECLYILSLSEFMTTSKSLYVLYW